MGYGLVFPITAYTAEAFGTSAAVITLVLSLHPLMRLLSGPLWGSAADTFGRKPVMIVGIALSALGHLAFAMAGSLWTLAIGRALTGLGTGEIVAAAALVADLTPEDRRAEGIGQLRASYGLGMLLGPLFGGALALHSLSTPALTASACSLLTGLFVAAAIPSPPRAAAPARAPLDLSLLSLRHAPHALWIAAAGTLSLALAESIVALAIEHVLTPRVRLPWLSDLPPQQLSLLLVVALLMGWGLTMAFVEGWLVGKLAPAYGEIRLVRVGLALWILAFLLTPLAYLSGLLVCAIIVVWTAFAAGLVSTATSSLFSRLLPRERQGSGFGLYQSSAALGEFIGPAISGALFGAWFGAPYLAGSLILATALAAALLIRPVNAPS